MIPITDEIRVVRTWKMEHYGQNPKIAVWLENKSLEEKRAIQEFMNFLSDNYPDIRPVLFGPPKSVEEWEEKE